jgi:hypothetical protein
VFLSVSNLKFLVEWWDRRGRMMKGVVNDLLLVMFFLFLVIYCKGICVKEFFVTLWGV